MFKCKKTKFWLERPINLLCNYDIVPLNSMGIPEQMNAITRLIIIIFILLTLMNFSQSILFLLISLVLIIILYYIQRNQMEQFKKENFKFIEPTSMTSECPLYNPPNAELKKSVYNPSFGLVKDILKAPNSKYFWGQPETILDNQVFNNKEYISPNQRLAGCVNPKTLIQPVMVPKSHDLEFWRTNNAIVHTAINDLSQIELYQSGQYPSTCCPPTLSQANGSISYPLPYPKHDVPLKIYDQNMPIESYMGPANPQVLIDDDPNKLGGYPDGVNNGRNYNAGDPHPGVSGDGVQVQLPYLKVDPLPLQGPVVIPN